MPEQARVTGERFARQLVEAHDAACPWRGSTCALSLLQFPPLTQVRRGVVGVWPAAGKTAGAGGHIAVAHSRYSRGA